MIATIFGDHSSFRIFCITIYYYYDGDFYFLGGLIPYICTSITLSSFSCSNRTCLIGEKLVAVPEVITPAISILFRESCLWFKAWNFSTVD
jgi:hypothetical protein